ncbi:MAG: AraC family transcriptional regulator [Gemmatimonadales bacterium]|nr:MAG: AraC family transcriptional regulator [Gemmatimonadales bacterium]
MRIQPRPLLLMHENRLLRERVRRAARDRFRLIAVEDWDELREGISQAPPAAIALVDPYQGQPEGDGPSLELHDILTSFPSATVIVAMDTDSSGYRDLWLLGEWGIAEVLQIYEDTSQGALRRRLLSARAQPLRRLLAHDSTIQLTGRARSILDAAVATVMVGGYPKEMARSLRFSPSTMLRWCERSQLPTPRRLLLWMRMLFAAALLDDPGHSVFSVALACGYSGDQALRRALKSVVPHSPTQLRKMGAFDTVSQAFFDELASLRDLDQDRV